MGFQDIGLKIVLLGVREFDRNTTKVEKNVDEMNRSLDKTKASAKKASTGITKYSETSKKAATNTKKLTKETESLSTKFSKLGSNVTALGVGLTAGLTVPLNLLRNQLIGIGIDFEDAFSDVSKTVDGVSDDFGILTDLGKELRKGIVDLSLVLPITADELAGVAAAAGQLGVKGTANILKFTEIAAGMGVATDLASKDAAIALARLSKILGISEQDFVAWAQGAANATVELGNNVAATESQIINMALRLAPAATMVGLTTQEILGLSASLAEVGVQSELGGTAVSRVFLEMAEASGSLTAANAVMKDGITEARGELNQLRSLLNRGVTDFEELKFALRGTSLDLSGVSSMLNDLGTQGGSFDNLNSRIQRNNITLQGYRRTLDELSSELQNLGSQLAAGTITQEQYAEKANRIKERQADVNDQISKASITAQDYQRNLRDLNSEFVSIDDIITQVSRTTLTQLEGAFASAQSKIGVFADIMGVSEEAFAAAFGAKPLETFQTFLAEVAKLQDEGKITSETLATLGLSGLRVRQVLNILGPNIELVTGNIELSNQAWIEQTALQIEVQKKFATTAGKIQLAKNAFNALGIAVFDFVKPSIDKLLGSVTDLIKKFTDFFTASEENAELISKLFIAASLLGPALIAVGIAIRTIAIASKALALGTLFAPLITIATNPLIIAGIAAIAGAFFLIKENIFGLGDLFNQVAGSITNIFGLFARFLTQGSIANPIQDLIGNIASGDISGAFDSFKDVGKELITFTQTILIPALGVEWAKIKVMVMDSVREATAWLDGPGEDMLLGFIDDILKFITATAPKVSAVILKWADTFTKWIVPLIPIFVKEFGKLLSAVVKWISTDGVARLKSAINVIADIFSTIFNNLEVATILVELARVVGIILGALTAAVLAALSVVIPAVIDFFKGVDWEDVLDFFGDIFDAFITGFVAGFKGMVGAGVFDSIIDSILGFLSPEGNKKFKEDLLNLGKNILESIGKGIALSANFLWDGLKSVINALIDLVKDILGISSASTVFMGIGEDIIQGLWDGIKFIWNTFIGFMQDRIEQIIENWTAIVPVILQVGKDIIIAVQTGIQFGWGAFLAWVQDRINEIVNKWTAILADILTIGKNIVVSIQGGIQSGWAAFIEWVGNKAGEIKIKFTSLVTDMLQIGRDIVDGIKSGITEKWDDFTTWLNGLMPDIPDVIKDFFSSESPSKLTASIGRDIVDGLRVGMEEAVPSLLNTVAGLAQNMLLTATVQTAPLTDAVLGAALGSTIMDNTSNMTTISKSQTFAPNITGVPMQDERSAGNELMRQWRMAQVTGNVL